MSAPREPLLYGETPAYAIVRACRRIGIDSPEDVGWRELISYMEESGHPLPDPRSAGWDAFWRILATTRAACCCGKTLPRLARYQFTFNDGTSALYSFGQCGQCRTVFWHRG